MMIMETSPMRKWGKDKGVEAASEADVQAC
jgi:hypothetical protein